MPIKYAMRRLTSTTLTQKEPRSVLNAYVCIPHRQGVMAEWSACLAADHEVVGLIPASAEFFLFSLDRTSSLKYTSEHLSQTSSRWPSG